jgi:hypothetical protein
MVGEVSYSGGSGWAGHGTGTTTLAKHLLDLRDQDAFTNIHEFRRTVRAHLHALATAATEALVHS